VLITRAICNSENITELVSSDSVVAVKAEDDNIEYYMLKVTSGLETLSTTEKDSFKTGIVNKNVNSRNMNYSNSLRVANKTNAISLISILIHVV
jgi:hypothetical protein